MYLSRLMLNPRSRRVQRELANPYGLHITVYGGYPQPLPPEERVLYRVDEHPRSGTPMLLVQSQGEPDWTGANGSSGYLLERAECKAFTLAPATGQLYAFRLRANPTVKKATHDREPVEHSGWVAEARVRRAAGERAPGDNGVRLGLTREEDQRAWLDRQAERCGFAVHACTVMPEGVQRAERPGGRRMSHLAVRYEGVLEVMDARRFEDALGQGIGPARAFGFGLLSLGPAGPAA